jgi:outer membrane protein
MSALATQAVGEDASPGGRLPWAAMTGVAFTAALLLAAAPTAAQQSGPLTLEQARALAMEHNPAYRQARNAVVSARAGEMQSRAAFLPTLSAGFNSGGYLSRSFTGTDPYGKPVRRDDPLEYTGSSSGQSIGLNLQLFDGGRRFREMRAARAGREAAVAAVDAAASTMDAELTRRYYEAQRTAALIRLEEELLKTAEASHGATERLLRVAAASPVDLLGAEFEVSRQRQAVEAARDQARVAMLALAEQIGTGEAEGWALVTELPEVVEPARFDADDLVARAHAVSPRLAELAARARQAEQQRRAAGATRWPTVSARTSFGRSMGTEGYDALFDPNPLNQSFSFGIDFSLPLFSQYQTTEQITQARVSALNADESARATRLQLDREVRTALIELESAYRTVELNNASTELARRRLDLANRQFRLGSLSFTELQAILTTTATAEREALNARYAFAAALATLEEKVGGEL